MTEVRGAATPDEIAAALAVRHVVFVVEQGVPPDLELDGLDGDAEHLIAIEAGRVVATCRLLHDPSQHTTTLGRMAVERPARGRGLAGALLSEADRAAHRAGTDRIVLKAQLEAMPVYARAGYEAYGDVVLDAGIDHRWMAKQLDGGGRP